MGLTVHILTILLFVGLTVHTRVDCIINKEESMCACRVL